MQSRVILPWIRSVFEECHRPEKRKDEMMRKLILPVAVLLTPLVLSGCAAVAAGTAGALIVDEGIIENDGKFDPLENTQIGRTLYDTIY